jgi:hypothetical protein
VRFRREPNGSVTVERQGDQLTLTADMWASIVASVSAQGETQATWTAARALHDSTAHDPADDDSAIVRAIHRHERRSPVGAR